MALLRDLRETDVELYAALYERIAELRRDPGERSFRRVERWLPGARKLGRVSTVATAEHGTWAILWTLEDDEPTVYVRRCERLLDEE
jgi:hypothetical protein